jgi:secretion/DNA translocation related CpaE-like protein
MGAKTIRAAAEPGSPARRVSVDPGAAPLVVTGDLDLLDQILAATAAVGVEPTVTADVATIRPQWTSAPMVLVGLDRAAQCAEKVLPRRTEVYVVGSGGDAAELARWSAPLGAAVVGMPDGTGLLTAVVADVTGHPGGEGVTVAVVGGSGGVGTSTLAAGLAVGASARGLSALLVDLDPGGGGIDLLVGAEGAAGWRWPRLSAAHGHLGDLTGHLPRAAGLDVLSAARGSGAETEPGPDPVRAVLLSASRSHRLVVVDLARPAGAVGTEVLRRAERTLLVVGADVRGIAAAQQRAVGLRESVADVGVVVRRPRRGGIEPRLVAEALELPLAGTLAEDPSLRQAAERGDPPGRAARSPVARLSRKLLADLELPVG